jgi:PKHD-type hydroxylase
LAIEHDGGSGQAAAVAQTYLALADAFTAEECDRIIALAATGRAEPGPVWGGAGYDVDPGLRDVYSSFLARADGADWLFGRLDTLLAAAAQVFALPVGPIEEDIQVLRYEVGCHFGTWHTDAGRDRHDRRRISMSVELSHRADYDGGELEIVPDRIGRPRALPRGAAQLFTSRSLHRVTPVSRGRRWSLVAWTGAPRDGG